MSDRKPPAAPLEEGPEEKGRIIQTEVSGEVSFLCCPFGFHVLASDKLAHHVLFCKSRSDPEFAGHARCPNNVAHVVADACLLAEHEARCSGKEPPPDRTLEIDLDQPISHCKACGSAVAISEYVCWWCHALFPHVLTQAQADARVIKTAYDTQRKEAALERRKRQKGKQGEEGEEEPDGGKKEKRGTKRTQPYGRPC